MGVDGSVLRATFVLVVVSLCLIPAGLAGLGASLPFALALGTLAAVLLALRDRLDAGPAVSGEALSEFGVLLWTGPAIAAAVCLAFLGATPAELQALGGLAGLVGMSNYFLRPVYRTGHALVCRLVGAGG
jgi:hypothetical protein